MKKILVVDGGPRRNMNTAALCDAFAEGAKGVSPEIETERVRLYDLPPYKGCVSCLACKLKGRATGLCALRDGLSDTLRAANEADGLAIASPIYFSEWTAMTRAFLERLVFPWLSYETFSCAAPKKMPLAWIYTMNAPEPMMADIRKHLAILEGAVARGLGDPAPQSVEAHSTVQVKDYARYAMDGLDPAAHLAWRAEEPLDAALRRAARPALAGVDTRSLTLHLRSRGTLKAMIACSGKLSPADAVAAARAWSGLDGQDYASAVSCPAPCDWPLPGSPEPPAPSALPDGFPPAAPAAAPLVAVLDFGVKRNTLRALAALGARVRVYPARTPAADLLAARPAGLLLSNGPGDPAALPYAIQTIRALLGKLPIMGICLGHQLLALALGAKTARLPFGHHGCNHPVRRLADGAVEITSQNHNFVVLEDTLDPSVAAVTHRNLNDGSVEGLEAPALRAFSLQYHPEAAPGPHDATPAFLRFLRTLP